MSAYIVSDRTVSLIVEAFITYEVQFKADDYDPSAAWIGGCKAFIDMEVTINSIGQSLLNQNYRSVNYRYGEDDPIPTYRHVDVSDKITDLGAILGCINCYNYQACETPDYETTNLYKSLNNLQYALYQVALKRLGYTEFPWGIE